MRALYMHLHLLTASLRGLYLLVWAVYACDAQAAASPSRGENLEGARKGQHVLLHKLNVISSSPRALPLS